MLRYVYVVIVLSSLMACSKDDFVNINGNNLASGETSSLSTPSGSPLPSNEPLPPGITVDFERQCSSSNSNFYLYLSGIQKMEIRAYTTFNRKRVKKIAAVSLPSQLPKDFQINFPLSAYSGLTDGEKASIVVDICQETAPSGLNPSDLFSNAANLYRVDNIRNCLQQPMIGKDVFVNVFTQSAAKIKLVVPYTGLTNVLNAAFVKPEYCDTAVIRQEYRCSGDSISVAAKAVERIEWAFRCQFITADDRLEMLNGSSYLKRYPVFANADLTSVWIAPVDRAASCTVPAGFSVAGYCAASCYTPEQKLLFADGPKAIKEAKEEEIPNVVTLSDDATFEDLKFRTTAVKAYSEEIVSSSHDILVFRTRSGGSLKVTKNHPLIDAAGNIRAAESFSNSDSLIHYQLGVDPIVAIETEKYFGKVYNLTSNTPSLLGQVVVAQGFLNGSAYYQNEGVDYLNRRLLRRNLPEALIVKGDN